MRYLATVLFSLVLAGCSPVEYVSADQYWNGRQGYRDKEIAPGVFIIEVAQIGGYQFMLDYEATIATLKRHWERRASELCAAGYEGTNQIIQPIDAIIHEFYCPLRFCQEYPMVSGIIWCKKSIDL